MNNNLILIGTVKEPFIEKKMGKRGNLMVTKIETSRMSGVMDEVIIAVPGGLLEERNYVGEKIFLEGQFVSHNEFTGHDVTKRSHLILYALANTFYVTDEWIEDRNDLDLEGFLCKAPILRKKESGYILTDLLIAQNNEDGASNYIPSICWGNHALRANELSVGAKVHIKGRIQSRIFYRKNENDEGVPVTVYENSIWRFVSAKNAPSGKEERENDADAVKGNSTEKVEGNIPEAVEVVA